MKCPYEDCQHDNSIVKGTDDDYDTIIKRWRKCRKCGRTFTTIEEIRPDECFLSKYRYLEKGS